MNISEQPNPEFSDLLVPYSLYHNHKNARKQIQTQREQAQHTLSVLERQAKKSAKELETKQKTLLNYYQVK